MSAASLVDFDAILAGSIRYTVLEGHAIDVLRLLPGESVQCVVTSPPYFGLRAYGTSPQVWGGDPECGHPIEAWADIETPINNRRAMALAAGLDDSVGSSANTHIWSRATTICTRCGAWFGELGAEPHPDMFVAHLIEIFRELKRVLRDDGTVWVNLADSYSGSGRGPTGHNGIGNQEKRQGFRAGNNAGDGREHDGRVVRNRDGPGAIEDVPPKSQLCIPERLKLALLTDGWTIRNTIVWEKTAPMPESVQDRLTRSWEPIYLLAKGDRYYFDQEALRETAADSSKDRAYLGKRPTGPRQELQQQNGIHGKSDSLRVYDRPSRNGRDVWTIGPEPANYDYCLACGRFYRGSERSSIKKYAACDLATRREIRVEVCANCGASDAWVDHYAAFPSEIPRRAILAGTSERGACVECGTPWRRVAGQEWAPDCPPSCNADTFETRPCVVLDPFSGTGTTALTADRLGRVGVGIELSERYAALSRARIHADAPLFGDMAL